MKKRDKIIIIGFVIIIITPFGIIFYLYNEQQHQPPTQIEVTCNETIEKRQTIRRNIYISICNNP